MNVPERSLRAVSVLGAFLCGLVLVFGAILFVTSHSSSTGPALAAVGGPFHLVDQDGKEVVAGGAVADDKFLTGINFYVKGVEGKVPGGDKK